MKKPDYNQLACDWIETNLKIYRHDDKLRFLLAGKLAEMFEVGREFEADILEKNLDEYRKKFKGGP